MNNDHRIGFLAGLAGGIAFGVLYARRSTPTFRSLIAGKTHETLEDVKQHANDLADSATGILSKGKAGVMRKQEALMNALDAGIRAYQKTAG